MARSRSSSDSSRSPSPYNKRNRPPRRSRSTDRYRSNRGRRSSPRRSRSHSRRRSRDRRSSPRRRSPRRFSRRSPDPRDRRRRSRSQPRRSRSPRRRSRSPRRTSGSPRRRSRSPRRKSRSPKRRSRSPRRSPPRKRSGSPRRRSKSPVSKSTWQENKFPASDAKRRSVTPKTQFVEAPSSQERPRESRDAASKPTRDAEPLTARQDAARHSRPSGGGERKSGASKAVSTSKDDDRTSHNSGVRRRQSLQTPSDSGRRERPRSRSPASQADTGTLDHSGFYGTPSEKHEPRVRERKDGQPKRNPSPPHHHQGHGVIRQTSTSLHIRFSLAQGESFLSTFVPPELITIGIERNIPGNEPAVMRSEFRPEDIEVIRRKDEGGCPFYEREEFQTRPDEEQYTERRVIKVVRPDVSPRGVKGGSAFEKEYRMKNFEVRKPRSEIDADEKVTLSDRWGAAKRDPVELCSHAVENVIHRRRDSSDGDAQHERLPESRTSGLGREERPTPSKRFHASGEFDELDRYQRDPHDLRHNLAVKRRGGGGGGLEQADSRHRLLRHVDNESHRTKDMIQQGELHGKRGPPSGGKPKLTSLVGHTEVGARSMDTRTVLPDFSKRDNKYGYQAWEDHPEMIPRGSSYFEHDNREDFSYRGRRGSGRGPFRGRGRGMGRRDNDSFEPAWKHDKYEEMEDGEEDNKPTSTT